MSSVDFAIPDFCLQIPKVPSVNRQLSGRATLEEAANPATAPMNAGERR